jgi:hypothetical protein
MPSRLAADDFMKGMRLNIAVEHDDHSFWTNRLRLRDKIAMVEWWNDVTNKLLHLNERIQPFLTIQHDSVDFETITKVKLAI